MAVGGADRAGRRARSAAGGRAVGLTGADAGVAPVRRALPHQATSGDEVDLGLVGTPTAAPAPALISSLLKGGFIPIVACIGAGRDGLLYNVNADTFAGAPAVLLVRVRLAAQGNARIPVVVRRALSACTRTARRRVVQEQRAPGWRCNIRARVAAAARRREARSAAAGTELP